ncbi:DUF6571 family protein [Nonomuraea jabiensis]|uniref:DUF6571 domain-containing protein n=1 Tax=Nonomuraea jabiensis TaxID=882448 RepID=A0A7W9G0N0_9ACTN|nr:DUF6571 family protein [Nonomuraea jabiensis]MBB5775023.1 hypothetical protein [Nonomuraea jabiensis]
MTEPPLELQPKPFDSQYSGINPDVMDRFEPLFSRAGDLLRRNEPAVRRALEKLELDVSGLRAMREAEIWIRGKEPELRRRNDTIKAMNDTWKLSPGNGLIGLDEELHKKVSHDPDAYAAAIFLRETAKSSNVNKQALAQLEKHGKDPQFALKLLNALGPEKFNEVAGVAVLNEGDKDAQRLLAALGTALGAASAQLSSEWRQRLTANFKLGPHRGLARVLTYGTYNSGFLLEVARKLDAAERISLSSGAHRRQPMADVMAALGKNPQAAQDFFNSGDTLKYYTTVHQLGDRGEAVGQALEAATIKFRDHSGSEARPSSGYVSAKLASYLIHLEYGRIKAGEPAKSLVAPLSFGRILAAYIPDVARVAAMPGVEKPGVFMEDNPNLPGREEWGAQFDKGELRTVMEEAFKADDKALALVTAAQTAWASRLLDHGVGVLAAKHGTGSLSNAAQEAGAGFGLIMDAGNIAKIDLAKDMDETQKRNVKALLAVVNTGLAFPQTGAWPIGSTILGSWTGMIEDSVKGTAEKTAVFEANTALEQTRALLHQLGAQAMLNHGLYGSSNPPAKTHPWASLSDRRPGDDPLNAPNNFLKKDGQLMTPKEMSEGTGKRLNAYQTWLYRQTENNPWLELGVQSRLNEGYDLGISKYR